MKDVTDEMLKQILYLPKTLMKDMKIVSEESGVSLQECIRIAFIHYIVAHKRENGK